MRLQIVFHLKIILQKIILTIVMFIPTPIDFNLDLNLIKVEVEFATLTSHDVDSLIFCLGDRSNFRTSYYLAVRNTKMSRVWFFSFKIDFKAVIVDHYWFEENYCDKVRARMQTARKKQILCASSLCQNAPLCPPFWRKKGYRIKST